MADRPKVDVYQEVTDSIVARLEQGTVPWRKPWAETGLERNLSSGKPYRGINQLLLSMSEYGSPWWVTFRQAKERGGAVRKGERSTLVVFWKRLKIEDESARDGKRVIPMLRHYRVFNVEQCDGLEVPAPELEPREFSPIDSCRAVMAGYRNGPRVEHGGNPCYSPALDLVRLPVPSSFESDAAYYSTAFHELVHSTGHESRLAREGLEADVAAFGSPTYSREELVAEVGAAMLCGHAGISPATIEESAAYLAGWVKVLRGDPKLVVQAAGKAQRGADLILGTTFEEA